MPVRLTVYLGTFILALILILKSNHESIFFQVGLIFLGSTITSTLEAFISNFGLFVIFFKTLFIKRIRISFAYLIRIKIDQEYLLVKSKRFDIFQPPGGVFECYNDNIFNKFELSTDDNMKGIPSKDLRKIARKPRRIVSIINWFYKGVDREISPHREFIEELIDTSILPSDKFKITSFKFIKSHNDGITYSQFFKCHELKLFEIFELVPSPDQMNELLQLKGKKSQLYTFVTDHVIERNGYSQDNGTTLNIGSQTIFIL